MFAADGLNGAVGKIRREKDVFFLGGDSSEYHSGDGGA